MKNSVIIKIPSKMEYFIIVKKAIEEIAKKSNFTKENIENIIEAVKELVENAIKHAYKLNEGVIEVDIIEFENGLRIDIRDWGEPMSWIKTRAVPINLKEDKGFNRVYKLVDQFEFYNLGKEGKKFSIIKFIELHGEKIEDLKTNQPTQIKEGEIIIRKFQKGDEEAIAKLIYRNYGYTYLKDLFYFPKKILENENKKIYSVIAQIDDEIIGHFALIKSKDSNIAEVGVVVVDPRYKGRGIMGKMFDKLIDWAKELKFDAIFGEAIMFHPFSQKSNLSHGFCETALVLGRVNEDTSIKDNTISQKQERGSVLIGYKIFNPLMKKIHIPSRYLDKIEEIYSKCKNISYKKIKTSSKRDEHTKFAYFNDPLSNTAVLVIDKAGEKFEEKFDVLLEYARNKHSDMIYADINLETIECIDDVISFLNKERFFFSGVMFLKHKNMDYLRLQYTHSDKIGKKNVLCYSNFCKNLFEYIKKDEKRVKTLKKREF